MAKDTYYLTRVIQILKKVYKYHIIIKKGRHNNWLNKRMKDRGTSLINYKRIKNCDLNKNINVWSINNNYNYILYNIVTWFLSISNLFFRYHFSSF